MTGPRIVPARCWSTAPLAAAPRGGAAPPRARAEDPVPVVASDSTHALVLWGAVRGLATRQRAVVVLRFQEGLSEVEVARLLQLPSARSSRLVRPHEELLALSNQILELTKAIHAMDTARSPTGRDDA